jgi:uncharacterized protein YegP (UPF0339 family)
MYFDIHKNKQGEYWWVAKGENHETVCASETYTTKAAAKHGISVIKAGAKNASVYDETGEVSGDVSARRIAV